MTSDWPSSASRCLWDTSRLAFTANPPRPAPPSLRESRKNTARSVSRGEEDPPVARSSALTALPAPRTPTALADFAYPTSSALLVSAARSDWKLERPRPKDPDRILKHVLPLGGNPRGPPEVQSRFISHDKRFVAQDRPPPADSGETLQATSRLSYVEPTNIGRRPKQDARREERRRPQGPPALHQCAPRWLCGRDATSRRQHGGRRSRPRASAGCRAEPARSQRAQARTRPYRARANAGAWHSP